MKESNRPVSLIKALKSRKSFIKIIPPCNKDHYESICIKHWYYSTNSLRSHLFRVPVDSNFSATEIAGTNEGAKFYDINILLEKYIILESSFNEMMEIAEITRPWWEII